MKDDMMMKAPFSIVLITEDPQKMAKLSQTLRLNPGFDFEECNSTLAELNGTASKMASAHDLVIFQTKDVTQKDMDAISAIRRNSPENAVLLALSDDNMTLAQAQRLRSLGVNDVLAESTSSNEIEEKVAAWLHRRNAPAETQGGGHGPGKVISVAKARGGAGSTMLAVNLADQLLGIVGWRKKVATKKVALVDLDLQFGAVSGFLDIPSNDALYQLATDGSEPDHTFLSQSMKRLDTGLAVLSAPSRIAPLEALQKRQIGKLLEALRSEYDYVVVDLPRALVEWIAPVLEQSDLILLVTDSSVPAIHQARRLIDFYTEDNLNLPIDIVVNFEKKPLIRARHHAEAAKVLERPLKYWMPYQPKAAKDALDRGIPLARVSAGSALCKSIRMLGRSVQASLDHVKTTQPMAHREAHV